MRQTDYFGAQIAAPKWRTQMGRVDAGGCAFDLRSGWAEPRPAEPVGSAAHTTVIPARAACFEASNETHLADDDIQGTRVSGHLAQQRRR